jgi:Tol biopolymer transport system component
MPFPRVALCALACASLSAFADGPADRRPTDPHTVTSAKQAGAAALPVEALLTTNHTYGFAHSNDGRKLAYISDASGRPNLWIMNADGTGAQQLIQSNDRQTSARFTHDDTQVVYSQDRGGNEYYDIYVVPVSGGEPRNLTNTSDVSETVREFSPDGKLLAIAIKQKTLPSVNLAVMEWPGGAIRQLTHEADPKASWSENAWSPDGKFLYATRSLGIDDSDIFRGDVATGKADKLLDHAGKQLMSISAVSPDSRTLLLTSNAKGGYDNVALFDLDSKQLHWLTDTQWSANGSAFTPDGGSAVYVLNADGRLSTRFVDLKIRRESDRGIPPGMNSPAGAPTPFLPDGSMLLSHEDSSHPGECYRLARDNSLTQITHNANAELHHAACPVLSWSFTRALMEG